MQRSETSKTTRGVLRTWPGLGALALALLGAGCPTKSPDVDSDIQHTSQLELVGGPGEGDAHPAATPTPEPGRDPHRHVSHRFDDPEAWARRFENPARDAWQKPDTVIAALALKPSDVVADIGSATGYFPIRIGPHVPQGRVWGVDIEPGMIRYLNERARREGRTNVFSVLGQPDDPLLPERVNVVLIVDTYHHIANREAYFRNLKHYLAPEARVAIIEHRKGSKGGPPEAMKLTPEEIGAEMTAAGYELAKRVDALPRQNFFIYRVASSR